MLLSRAKALYLYGEEMTLARIFVAIIAATIMGIFVFMDAQEDIDGKTPTFVSSK